MKKPKVHALCHVCTSIREFGGPQHYNSGMYESNHVLDVKGLLDRVSGSGGNALHVDALMKSNPTTLANGSGAPSTCSGSRQLAGDDDTLSLCTQSTASSASTTFTVCERGGVSFRLAPAAGMMGLHSAPVSEDERAPFLRKLVRFVAVEENLASADEVVILPHKLKFFTSLRVETVTSNGNNDDGTRSYAFSIIASPSYCDAPRFDCLRIQSPDDVQDYIAAMETYVHLTHHRACGGQRHHGPCGNDDCAVYTLCYVKHFEDVAVPQRGGRSQFRLPFRRLRVQRPQARACDFVEVASVIGPAHVVPNFDERIDGVAQQEKMTERYRSFFLWKKHLPTFA